MVLIVRVMARDALFYIFLLIFAHGIAQLKLPVTKMSSVEYSHSKNYKLKLLQKQRVLFFKCFLVDFSECEMFPVSCDLLPLPSLMFFFFFSSPDCAILRSRSVYFHVEQDTHIQSNE